MGKDPSDTQLIEREITNIFKSNPATSMMEHYKLVQFLHDELRRFGFNDLEKVDILKYATIVRDPVTKESVIPFETRPTKSRLNEKSCVGKDSPGSTKLFYRK